MKKPMGDPNLSKSASERSAARRKAMTTKRVDTKKASALEDLIAKREEKKKAGVYTR
jgi:hypothetical protein